MLHFQLYFEGVRKYYLLFFMFKMATTMRQTACKQNFLFLRKNLFRKNSNEDLTNKRQIYLVAWNVIVCI